MVHIARWFVLDHVGVGSNSHPPCSGCSDSRQRHSVPSVFEILAASSCLISVGPIRFGQSSNA